MGQIFSLTSDDAEKIIAAAIQEAKKRNVEISISLHNRDQTEIAKAVMDGVKPLTALIASDKSHQSSWTGKSTRETRERVKTGEFTAENLGLTRIVVWAGGLPIYDQDGHLLGGIGVSNLPEDVDEEVAETAVIAAGFKVAP